MRVHIALPPAAGHDCLQRLTFGGTLLKAALLLLLQCAPSLEQRERILGGARDKDRCSAGQRLVSVERSRSDAVGTVGGVASSSHMGVQLSGVGCSRMQRPECTRDCGWHTSCRLAPAWCRYDSGRRAYIAGAKMAPGGHMLFYCCASFASSFESCNWSRARPLRGDGSLVHLAALQVVSGHATGTDAVLRDVITDPYNGRIRQYRVEVCKVTRERARCALPHMTESERRAFRLLLLSSARAGRLLACSPDALDERSIDGLRKEMFEEPKELPPLSVAPSTTALNTRPNLQSTTTQPVPQCPRHPDYAWCIGKAEAERRFGRCCELTGVKKDCLRLCNYERSKTEVIQAVASGRCGSDDFNTVLRCASQEHDVTRCCDTLGLVQGRYSICRPFCDPAVNNVQLGSIRYLPCAERLQNISQCYIAYMNQL